MKLYFITITSKDSYWVVAEDTEKAYEKLRKVLDEHDLYFRDERSLKIIEVIGESYYDDGVFVEVN